MGKVEDLAARRARLARERRDAKAKAAAGTAPPAPEKAARCPVCGAPALEKYRPFCSARCADVDLGRWLKEGYRIATEEEPDPGRPTSTGED